MRMSNISSILESLSSSHEIDEGKYYRNILGIYYYVSDDGNTWRRAKNKEEFDAYKRIELKNKKDLKSEKKFKKKNPNAIKVGNLDSYKH